MSRWKLQVAAELRIAPRVPLLDHALLLGRGVDVAQVVAVLTVAAARDGAREQLAALLLHLAGELPRRCRPGWSSCTCACRRCAPRTPAGTCSPAAARGPPTCFRLDPRSEVKRPRLDADQQVRRCRRTLSATARLWAKFWLMEPEVPRRRRRGRPSADVGGEARAAHHRLSCGGPAEQVDRRLGRRFALHAADDPGDVGVVVARRCAASTPAGPPSSAPLAK